MANDFGDKLKRLRQAAGMTQRQLAKLAGVTQGAVSLWELGERDPGWLQVRALCRALRVACSAFEDRPAGGQGK